MEPVTIGELRGLDEGGPTGLSGTEHLIYKAGVGEAEEV